MIRELTGKHVLIIMVSFFGVIFAVNFLMAYKAVSTFPGVEARSTWYASQNFEATRKAQESLGWQVAEAYEDGRLMLRITYAASGEPANVTDMQVLVGRATESEGDQLPVFIREGGAFVAPVDLSPGKWVLRIQALAADGTPFRQQRQLFVKG
jgi:nitrogen fixation protein FixH